MPCAAPVTIAAVLSNRAIGSSLPSSDAALLTDRRDTIVAQPRLGESHAAFPADEEEIALLGEFELDEGERLRPLGADGTLGLGLRGLAVHRFTYGEDRM